MPSFTAVYDACVLYPAALRDLLLHLAVSDLFRARWSNDIHEEWIRNVLQDRPDLPRERLLRTRDLMNTHVRGCVVQGYHSLIDALTLPDPDDRHVLAAAIVAGADIIVTYNLKDFPTDALAPYEIEAQHPDTFTRHLIDLDPNAVLRAVREQRANLTRPTYTVNELLATFTKAHLHETVAFLQDHKHLI